MGALQKALLAAFAVMVFSAVCSGTALATTSDAQEFAQRAADDGRPGAISAVLGAYPPGWTPPVPLPTAMPLLGSISRASQRSVEAFYKPADAQDAINTYEAQLRAAGFVPTTIPAFQGRGFLDTSTSDVALFCRGLQGVDVRIPARKSDDVRVTVLSDENQPLNPCVTHREPQQPFANPVPALIAPAGVIEVTALGGSSSVGYAATGLSANVSSTVLLRGPSNAATIASAYAREFELAGWRKIDAIASKSSAAAAFTTTFQGQNWAAMLGLYPASTANQYIAVLSASGKPAAARPKAVLQPVLSVSPQLTKDAQPAVLQLLQRELNPAGTDRVAIYLHRAPPQLPAGVPMPHGDLLGSTMVAPQVAADGGPEPYAHLYYSLTQNELNRYLSTLVRTGWREDSSPLRAVGGFVATQPTSYTYCKRGKPGLAVIANSGSNAVTISVAPEDIAAQCGTFTPPAGPAIMSLPTLHAPGTVVSRWTSEGMNAASFTSSLAPAALLDAFAQQLKQLGWQPGSRSANDSVGTQSFTHTESDGKRHEACLTLYRYSGDPSVYGAVIDVTTMP